MKTKISSFLKERLDRFKPEEANKLNLRRLQKIDFSGKMHFLDNKKTNTNMILIKNGDLVISGINVEKGAIAIYQGEEDITATIHYSSYGFDEKKIDVEYFKRFLKSKIFRDIVNAQIGGGIKTELKPKRFLPLEIDLPDLKIQKQILKKIQSMEKEIRQLEQSVSHDKKRLPSLRQSILSEAVQGKLVSQNPKDEPASELLKKIKVEKEELIKEGKIKKGKELPPIEEDEVPYELPKGWVWTRLGEVCTLVTDGTHYTPRYVKEGVPFLSVKDMSHGKINFSNSKFISKEEHEELTKRCKPEYMDLLLTKVGTTGIGRLVDTKQEFSIFVSVALLKYSQELIYPYYLEHLINSPFVKNQSSEGTEGVGNKNLVLRKIVNFLVPLPPLAEQRRIVEKVDSLMKFCDELGLKIKENKKSSENLMGAVLKESFENGK